MIGIYIHFDLHIAYILQKGKKEDNVAIIMLKKRIDDSCPRFKRAIYPSLWR